jgi:hypothetical protein
VNCGLTEAGSAWGRSTTRRGQWMFWIEADNWTGNELERSNNEI